MEFNLRLTDVELRLVVRGLSEIPYKFAHPILLNIDAQIKASQKVPECDVPEPDPKPTPLEL